MREVIDQPDRRRDLDALWKEKEPGCSQNGENSRRRWKPDQNRSKYLLSLAFMVWQEVYLADDSRPSQPHPCARRTRAFTRLRPCPPGWVIEVTVFQCPYCKQWHDQTYPAFRDQYVNTGKVRLAYVNFPLAIHAQAWPAAESAMCA